jgi:hypothetical protein
VKYSASDIYLPLGLAIIADVNSIEESKRTDIISVSGYGFDREDVLRAVRRYDSRAS